MSYDRLEKDTLEVAFHNSSSRVVKMLDAQLDYHASPAFWTMAA